jgi:hypothetical protein
LETAFYLERSSQTLLANLFLSVRRATGIENADATLALFKFVVDRPERAG